MLLQEYFESERRDLKNYSRVNQYLFKILPLNSLLVFEMPLLKDFYLNYWKIVLNTFCHPWPTSIIAVRGIEQQHTLPAG